ncbi:hypothetical protein B0T17DRAFT_458507, partial [Bombardia bombarda]
PRPRRGRREKPWPPAKQKKLLRLYVCTQSERLPLVRILERLKDDSFDPRQRNSHKHLKSLLPDRRIDDWRPRDLETMHIRVRFLRSVRAEKRMKRKKNRDRHLHLQPYEVVAGHVVGDVAVTAEQTLGFFTEVEMGRLPMFKYHQYEAAGSTPPGASTATESTATPDSYPRDKSPSIMSKSSSAKSANKRLSWASVVSSISSGISSLARSSSSASSKGIGLNEGGNSAALSKLSREDFLSLLEEKPEKAGKPAKTSNNMFRRKQGDIAPTHEELNAALVESCCHAFADSDRRGCIHKRLSAAIDAQRSEGEAFCKFSVTDAEANKVDKFGNSLLHTAARWGARVSILLLLLRHTVEDRLTNERNETFLHLWQPPSHPHLRPASFLNLVRSLRARGFDFCQRDVGKRPFLHHLVAKKEFPVEILHCLFREIGHGAARFLVATKSSDDERLWHCVRKNLAQRSPKLQRVFGDEVEFVRRYLPEFSDSRSSSSRDVATPASECPSWAHGCRYGHDSQDLSHSGGLTVKRTPLMELLRRIASSGKDTFDRDLEAELASVLGSGAKAPNSELRPVLNARDTEGNTALHYAAEFGIVAGVKFLCQNGSQVNAFNNCGNTPLQLVKYAIQRTDVASDVQMEARYIRCAVLLLDRGAIDQSKLVSERSVIFPYDVFDGSERSIANLERQGVASQCKGLHLLSPSRHHHMSHHLYAHEQD